MRKGPFKEPVTVKVNGLPAGLKADPVTVAAGAADFAVKVVADAKAAAGHGRGPASSRPSRSTRRIIPPAAVPLAVKVLPAK